jgi:uncharacterized protein
LAPGRARAGANAIDPLNGTVRRVLAAESGPLILPAPVTAEADFMLRKLGGAMAARRLLSDIADRLFRVEALARDEHGLALRLHDRYKDLDIADLSVMVLARRFGTRRVLTFDERHFRAVQPLHGGWFVLLPADSP